LNKKIKIVYIISNLGLGGAQVLVFDILNNLIKKDDLDLSVITIDSGDYIEKFEKAGIKLYDLKEKGLINPFIFFKMKKVLKDLKPDIVHTHLLKADFYGRLAAKKAGVPLIISTIHAYSTRHTGADIKNKSLNDRLDNFAIKYSDCKLIAVSKIIKEYLVNRDESFEKNTEVIYNGVNIEKSKNLLNDKERLNFRKINNIAKDDFVITIAGRIEKSKGHMFFFESVKDLLQKNKNIKVLIIGDGNFKENIEKIKVDFKIEDQIILKKFEKNIEAYIEISDLICVPSLWEGFGLVVIEGMIKSKIVLASDVGGIPEIIENGNNGFLFESENKEDLIGKLMMIINNEIDSDKIKENAILTVKDKFDIAKNSDSYYEYYKNHIEI